jgi:hypothetical protein
MGVLLMGFKSPVRKLHMETYIITIRNQLWEGNQPGEGRLGEIGEPMDKNRIEGRRSGTSWHNTAKSCRLVAAVNAAVAPRSNTFLSGEILHAKSVKEVSRDHSNHTDERGSNALRLNEETRGLRT